VNIDDAKDVAVRLLKHEFAQFEGEELSEADTRSKLVDALLLGALGWKEHSIQREPAAETGFVDYLLHTSRVAFVIEAKKNTKLFTLPSTSKQRRFKIGGALSGDKDLRKAIDQCRAYGVAKGTSFCCVTNGIQYVFFRSHSDDGLEFSDHQATVFSSPEDVLANFVLFYSLLSFDSVAAGGNFSALPVGDVVDVSSKFKELTASPQRSRHRTRNRLFPFIRDVVSEVFQDLAEEGADEELIVQCYVESAQQNSYEQSLRALVRERPALADGNIEPLQVTRRSAGAFDKVLDAAGSRRRSPAEVVMLLGGIGAGKTTFIRRFRKVIAKTRIDEAGFWVDVNFNRYSEAPGELEPWVVSTVTVEAEKNYPELGFGTYGHLRQAYHVEYERLKKGRLAPIFQQDPNAFELKFSDELESFEKDSIPHLIRLLSSVQGSYGRRVFLIFDNADQFSDQVQNDVFMLAHRIAQEVGCTLVVSLREESYWKNKNFGALSAFHSMNFYVEAPNITQVIAKRFKYASELLSEMDDYVVPSTGLGVTQEEGSAIFESVRNTVLNDKRFMDFLQELSPGEVRRPLGQLARFLFSGHTNVDSVLRGLRTRRPLKIGFHEFVKSVALGDAEQFREDKSDLVNLFALTGTSDASNANRLAILGCIYSFRKEKGEAGLGYIPMGQVVDICADHGIARDTTREVMQFFNSRRVLEVDQQTREGVLLSRYIRTTRAFDYYIGILARQFTYVDLVIPGTAIPQSEYYNMLERISSQIYAVGPMRLSRLERIRLRLERAQLFSRFLRDEATKHSMFKAGKVDQVVVDFVEGLEREIARQADRVVHDAEVLFSPRERPASHGR
jgi:hypothetical protein